MIVFILLWKLPLPEKRRTGCEIPTNPGLATSPPRVKVKAKERKMRRKVTAETGFPKGSAKENHRVLGNTTAAKEDNLKICEVDLRIKTNLRTGMTGLNHLSVPPAAQ